MKNVPALAVLYYEIVPGQQLFSLLRQLNVPFIDIDLKSVEITKELSLIESTCKKLEQDNIKLLLVAFGSRGDYQQIISSCNLPIIALPLNVGPDERMQVPLNLPHFEPDDYKNAALFSARFLRSEIDDVSVRMKQIEPKSRLKAAAAAVIVQTYPDEIKQKMKKAWDDNQYQQVIDTAADYDILHREELDAKITQIPNPECALIGGGHVASDTEAKIISPFLFKVEGIDEYFPSASEAMAAYRKLHEIKGNDVKHVFKKSHVLESSLMPKVEEE